MMLEPGLYEHFKGGLYQLVSVARHSENDELMVVYRALYGDAGFWVRPLSMFIEEIDCDGELRPRFKRLESQTGVLEVAYLDVKEGQQQKFAAVMERASPLIAASEGYISHQVKSCVEKSNRFLLLVDWVSVEHHTEGFKKSDRYREWSKLLHDFYDPFPEVWHFKHVF